MFERYNKEGVVTKDAVRYTKADEEIKKAALELYYYLNLQGGDSSGGDAATTKIHEDVIRDLLYKKYQIKLKPEHSYNNPENPDISVNAFMYALLSEGREDAEETLKAA